MELIEDYSSATSSKRSPSLRPLSTRGGSASDLRRGDEDSWTSVDHQELDHAVRGC